MKKRVAIVLHGLSANGIETLFANLSDHWDYEKFEIYYLLAVDKGAKPLWEDKVVSNGVKVIHITDLDGRKLLKWPQNLKSALKQYGPFDAIHVNMESLNGIHLNVARKAGINVRICHAHNSSNVANKGIKGFVKKTYLAKMKKMMHKNATCNLACSDLAGDNFYGKNNYTVIYNGIDLNSFSKTSTNIPNKYPVFITVGRMAEQKNPIFLVDVFNEIVKLIPQAKLIWIGSGSLEGEIKSRVSGYHLDNSVEFLGVISDVYNILPKADYFLFPSLFEGLGNVLIEAQAAGLDCFVSDDDLVPKMADCGKCVFISLEKNAAEWAKIIFEYIKSGKHNEVDQEKLSRFDIKNMARELEKIYAQ